MKPGPKDHSCFIISTASIVDNHPWAVAAPYLEGFRNKADASQESGRLGRAWAQCLRSTECSCGVPRICIPGLKAALDVNHMGEI